MFKKSRFKYLELIKKNSESELKYPPDETDSIVTDVILICEQFSEVRNC
jgi:hypothetical protein